MRRCPLCLGFIALSMVLFSGAGAAPADDAGRATLVVSGESGAGSGGYGVAGGLRTRKQKAMFQEARASGNNVEQHQALQVDAMVRKEMAASAAQSSAASAVAQAHEAYRQGKGVLEQAIPAPESGSGIRAPKALGKFELPADYIVKGDGCEAGCVGQCTAFCQKQNKGGMFRECRASCHGMCKQGCRQAVGGTIPSELRVNYHDCVPGCNAECMPTCIDVSKDPKSCIGECQEFCDRDCFKEATGEDLSPYQQRREARKHRLDSMPGDRGRDNFESIKLGGRKGGGAAAAASVEGCEGKCLKGCETSCPRQHSDASARSKCVDDCGFECHELCRPQDPKLAGTTGDRLLAEAEQPDARPADAEGGAGEQNGGSDFTKLHQGFYTAGGVLGLGLLALLLWARSRGGRPASGLVRYINKR